jgi:integrase/recombinase XerD
MSRLREELDRYLRIRRSLGWDLRTTERVLWRFISFAESQSAEHISTNLFLKWQQSFGRASRQTWPARLGMVRLFQWAARPRSST